MSRKLPFRPRFDTAMMNVKNIVYIIFSLLCSCKTQRSLLAQQAGSSPTANKMACRLKGEIIEILNILDADNKAICGVHPCLARVKVLEAGTCGPSVPTRLQQGDTIQIRFIYSLSDTRKLFQNMNEHYPGMRKGNIFSTDVEARLKPGTNGEWVVYGYAVEKK